MQTVATGKVPWYARGTNKESRMRQMERESIERMRKSSVRPPEGNAWCRDEEGKRGEDRAKGIGRGWRIRVQEGNGKEKEIGREPGECQGRTGHGEHATATLSVLMRNNTRDCCFDAIQNPWLRLLVACVRTRAPDGEARIALSYALVSRRCAIIAAATMRLISSFRHSRKNQDVPKRHCET